MILLFVNIYSALYHKCKIITIFTWFFFVFIPKPLSEPGFRPKKRSWAPPPGHSAGGITKTNAARDLRTALLYPFSTCDGPNHDHRCPDRALGRRRLTHDGCDLKHRRVLKGGFWISPERCILRNQAA